MSALTDAFFATQKFKKDARKPLTKEREREFHNGWRAAQAKDYTDATLQQLTWNNLGYRCQRQFPGEDPDRLLQAFADEHLLSIFGKITVWKRGGQRAPHKPLLLLIALARVQRKDPRLVPFSEIEGVLRDLLDDFGPPRKTAHPEFPFWYLQNDSDLWELDGRDRLQNGLKEATAKSLRDNRIQGGFTNLIDQRLRTDPELVNQITNILLEDNFSPSLHEDLLDAVGMPWVVTRRRRRDPAFRKTILRIYEHRCAICGYDGRLGRSDLAIEAAHVRMHASGGPDLPENGMALCVFHHRAFDRGAMGLDEGHRILVSQDVHGQVGVDELLLRFGGQPLRSPQAGSNALSTEHIQWHQREVFRAPARAFVS